MSANINNFAIITYSELGALKRSRIYVYLVTWMLATLVRGVGASFTAVTFMVWLPLAIVVVFHIYTQAVLLKQVAAVTPSIDISILATPLASEAVTRTITWPLTVVPFDGDRKVIAGPLAVSLFDTSTDIVLEVILPLWS